MKTMLHKYRFLIRHLPDYPSRSRYKFLISTREEFRLNKNETDPVKLKEMEAEVNAGIKEVLRYKNLDPKQSNWSFQL
ncbi:hypothetical protein CYY_000300 [Polysphondylium violaceum]|uniref:Complex 1 LYR protein domain-containing protein n=1 Tax=Polysphondylium violaceum TaxID=133409 RepID=A0A8J4V5U6_9MYCE|nr:hypothetical protein CYY_000300 [Polysphondylium violaceum]